MRELDHCTDVGPSSFPKYDNMHGTGYAQVAISTRDVNKAVAAIQAAGGAVTQEPGPVPGSGTKAAVTTDPDGWRVMLMDETS